MLLDKVHGPLLTVYIWLTWSPNFRVSAVSKVYSWAYLTIVLNLAWAHPTRLFSECHFALVFLLIILFCIIFKEERVHYRQTESNVVWYFENWTPQTVSHPIVIFVVTRLFIVTLLNQTTCEHPLRWNVPLKHNEKIKNVLFYTFPAISLRGIPAWFQRVHIRGWRVRLVLWLGGGGGGLGAGHHPAGGGGQLGRAPLARRLRGENWWGIELQASLCGDFTMERS